MIFINYKQVLKGLADHGVQNIIFLHTLYELKNLY